MPEKINIEKLTRLTEQGKNFIRNVCSKTGNSLLSGNDGILVYSDDGNGNIVNKLWTANVKNDKGEIISKNSELAPLLINWYEEYGRAYDLDPNILAAQAYAESAYKVWAYPPQKLKSTAMGLSQFIMSTLYDVAIRNIYRNVQPFFSKTEIAILTKGLTAEKLASSYVVGSSNRGTNEIARKNHPILLQNVMDNPNLAIKAQARYMKYISNKCNKLASTTLFCYNRGSGLTSDTYTGAITNAINYANEDYIKEGVNYVDRIFKFLGDNSRKYSFGFNLDFTFDAFATNVIESENI